MDNHYESIRGSGARIELNNLGYPINGNDMVDTVIQSMIVSMAKQIKDLQDIVSGPKPSVSHGDGWYNTDTGEFKRYDINVGKWVSQEEFGGNKNA